MQNGFGLNGIENNFGVAARSVLVAILHHGGVEDLRHLGPCRVVAGIADRAGRAGTTAVAAQPAEPRLGRVVLADPAAIEAAGASSHLRGSPAGP